MKYRFCPDPPPTPPPPSDLDQIPKSQKNFGLRPKYRFSSSKYRFVLYIHGIRLVFWRKVYHINDFYRVIDLINDGAIQTDSLVTSEIDLFDVNEIVASILNKQNHIKIMLSSQL